MEHISLKMEENQIKEMFEILREQRQEIMGGVASIAQSLTFYDKRYPDIEYILSLKVKEKTED
jgi:hypothetical protein